MLRVRVRVVGDMEPRGREGMGVVKRAKHSEDSQLGCEVGR